MRSTTLFHIADSQLETERRKARIHRLKAGSRQGDARKSGRSVAERITADGEWPRPANQFRERRNVRSLRRIFAGDEPERGTAGSPAGGTPYHRWQASLRDPRNRSCRHLRGAAHLRRYAFDRNLHLELSLRAWFSPGRELVFLRGRAQSQGTEPRQGGTGINCEAPLVTGLALITLPISSTPI